MKQLLSIDRSAGLGSWALYRDSEKLAEGVFQAGLPRTPTWYADVLAGLAAAGVKPTGIDEMLVGTGPGSFSGIRAVIAALQGLAMVKDLPVLGLASAAATARAVALREKASRVAVVGDARRGTYWVGLYDVDASGQVTLASTGMRPSHLVADFSLPTKEEVVASIPGGTLIVTPEYGKLRALLETIPGTRLVEGDSIPTAADLAGLYLSDPAAAIRDPLPIYLHPAVVG